MSSSRQYTSAKSQANKEPSWFLVIMLSGFISGILLFTVGWYLSLPDAQKDTMFHKILSAGDIFPGLMGFSRPKVLLVMGVDMAPKGSKDAYQAVRTDTMMLVKLDTANHKVNIVSIPRDSKVYLAGNQGINKINAAFAIGGADLALATVENTFGIDIDHYLVINLRGVHEVVDALGGLDIFVEKPMYYRDYTAGLNIALQPGQQHLDGKEAEGFLRFRHDALGDIGRIRRQQQFLSAMTAKLNDPSVLLKLKPLIEASSKYLLTDMSTHDLIRLLLSVKGMERSDFQVATLPGHASSSTQVSYWVIDPEQAEAVLNRLIIGVDSAPSEATDALDGRRVGILYTSSHQNMLASYKSKLERNGFRVVCQAKVHRSSTRLVTHNSHISKDLEMKLQQMNPLLQEAQLIFSPHGATFETNSCGNSDFTIILGDDTRSAVNP